MDRRLLWARRFCRNLTKWPSWWFLYGWCQVFNGNAILLAVFKMQKYCLPYWKQCWKNKAYFFVNIINRLKKKLKSITLVIKNVFILNFSFKWKSLENKGFIQYLFIFLFLFCIFLWWTHFRSINCHYENKHRMLLTFLFGTSIMEDLCERIPLIRDLIFKNVNNQ